MSDLDNFDTMPMPKPGEVPFESLLYREERRPDIEEFTADTKARVHRNFNESLIIRLEKNEKITAENAAFALLYLQAHNRAYPQQSHEYKPRMDGTGSKRDNEASDTAKKRIERCGQLMSPKNYKALQLLLVNDVELWQISARMGRGWGRETVIAKLNAALKEFGQIWGQTKINPLNVV